MAHRTPKCPNYPSAENGIETVATEPTRPRVRSCPNYPSAENGIETALARIIGLAGWRPNYPSAENGIETPLINRVMEWLSSSELPICRERH